MFHLYEVVQCLLFRTNTPSLKRMGQDSPDSVSNLDWPLILVVNSTPAATNRSDDPMNVLRPTPYTQCGRK